MRLRAKTRHVNQLIDTLSLVGHTTERCHHGEVLTDIHLKVERVTLGQIAYEPPHLVTFARDVMPAHFN